MDGDGGPPTQGWSKFASKQSLGSSSITDSKPWEMPKDLEKAVLEKEEFIRKETMAIKEGRKELEKLSSKPNELRRWIKQKENAIKIKLQELEKDIEHYKKEEFQIRRLVKRANQSSEWLWAEKDKFPLDFPKENQDN